MSDSGSENTAAAGNDRFYEKLAINIQNGNCTVIAFTGGGGKTSLIFRLTDELTAAGKKVIVTTTTHMAAEPERPFAKNGSTRQIKKNLEQYGYTLAACVDKESGKLCGLPENILESLTDFCNVLLIEADGSRGFPLKVPEAWEPVIPEFTDIVIGVIGLDSLWKTVGEIAHRSGQTARFLRKTLRDTVTAEDLIKITCSREGLRKGTENRAYRVYLNKADVLASPEPAKEICRKLGEQRIRAEYGSLKAGKIWHPE